MYHITYSVPDIELPIQFKAANSSDVLRMCADLIALGLTPTIHFEDLALSLSEFEALVTDARTGH